MYRYTRPPKTGPRVKDGIGAASYVGVLRRSRTAKAYRCKMGIEHVGHQLAEIGQLHDIGLDYLKADASFVRDLPNNSANQTLLRTLCTVGHSIGVMVIAEGVRTDEERDVLDSLGFDGVTGPGVTTFE